MLSQRTNTILIAVGKFLFFTFIALFSLELFSYIILALDPSYADDYRDTSYFEQEVYNTLRYFFSRMDAHFFIREFHELSSARYHPYLVYETLPYKGKYITMLAGVRETVNPCASSDSTTIWFFGGSVAMGYLARDSKTIPSLLSKELCDRGFKVNITNYGMHGYQSTQEMIKFILELKKNNKPNIIIFYDGFNDLYSVYQTGIIDMPQNLENRYPEFNSRDRFNILRPLSKKSNTFKLLHRFLPASSWKPPSYDPEQKATDIVTNYLHNVNIVRTLADDAGISALFIWQPHLFDRTNYYGQEESINRTADPRLRELAVLTSQKIAAYNRSILVSSPIFNYPSLDFMVYNDAVHTSELGNEIIAKFIAKMIVIYIK